MSSAACLQLLHTHEQTCTSESQHRSPEAQLVALLCIHGARQRVPQLRQQDLYLRQAGQLKLLCNTAAGRQAPTGGSSTNQGQQLACPGHKQSALGPA